MLLLERPTLSQFFRFRFVYGIFFCMKVDHHSYRRNVCSYEKKAWKKFRLVWVSKVAPMTAIITAIIFCHIILHPALSYIHNFGIFFLNHFAPLSEGELMPKAPRFFFSFWLKAHIISLILIAFIISIETEASLLALAKSICYQTQISSFFLKRYLNSAILL